MCVILEHAGNKDLDCKLAVRIWKNILGRKILFIEVPILVLGVLSILFLISGDFLSVIECALFAVAGILLWVVTVSKTLRKLLGTYEGKKFTFTDSDFGTEKTRFQYSDITKVVEKDEFVLIKIGRVILPIIKNEFNQQQIKVILELFRAKGISW